MTHITRYGRRLRITLICAMTIACFVCLFGIPFLEKSIFHEEVGYYNVVINGKVVGTANSLESAENALADARKRFAAENDAPVYMNNDFVIEKQSKMIAKRMSKEQLSKNIYTELFHCVVDQNSNIAYTLRIGDYMITLSSKEEILSLLKQVTAKYDPNKEFEVKLVAKEENSGFYSVDVVQAKITDVNSSIVAAALGGESTELAKEGITTKDGITEIGFRQDISVSEAVKKNVKIISVEDAYKQITAEKDVQLRYTVQLGDTIDIITKRYGISKDTFKTLNPNIADDAILLPGSRLNIVDKQSIIEVVVKQRMSYEEDYSDGIQYIDDDTAKRGESRVLSEGVIGHHKVTADITFVNGRRTLVSYLSEEIMQKPTAQVVVLGTQTPQNYIRPVVGGKISSEYGLREEDEFHKGLDIAVNMYTSVVASAAGTVTRAGWFGSYGYCVDIQHNDGSMTRYAHLDSVAVKEDQIVKQGELIAYSGNTGQSTGPHVHFEIWINNETVNPLEYINKN